MVGHHLTKRICPQIVWLVGLHEPWCVTGNLAATFLLAAGSSNPFSAVTTISVLKLVQNRKEKGVMSLCIQSFSQLWGKAGLCCGGMIIIKGAEVMVAKLCLQEFSLIQSLSVQDLGS